MYVRDLRDAGPSCGGKAYGLSRLIAAGLPVPPGFALDHAAFRHVVGDIVASGATSDGAHHTAAAATFDDADHFALRDATLDGPDDIGCALEAAAGRIATAELPPELESDVIARARELGSRVVVRSSATLEDGDAGSAAGIFASHACPADDVWQAIRLVWTSALTPLAVAYARRRGQQIAIGVVVQREARGQRVTVYTRPPGERDSDGVLVQRGGDLSRVSRTSPGKRLADRQIVDLALRSEAAIAAQVGGADVELIQALSDALENTEVDSEGRWAENARDRAKADEELRQSIDTWVVQARPIAHPAPRRLMPPPPIVTAALHDGREWTWDVTHNPDPLSPAQTGLVERVERAGLGAYSLRLCAGYLYSAPRTDVVAPIAPRDAAELAVRAQALEATATAILADPPTTIADAVERYLAFYAVWAGELAPLIASARSASSRPHARPSSVEAVLAQAARGELTIADVEARLGDLAPAWDVAVPTFGDRPSLLRRAVAAFASVPERIGNDSSAGEREQTPSFGTLATDLAHRDVTPSLATLPPDLAQRDETSSLAALAADLAERDDMLFARAQRLVRRAMIARAHELGIDPDDVFWLPFDEVVEGAAVDAETARRRAAGARAAAQRAAQWQMPLKIGGPPSASQAAHDPVLRGVGHGARVTGRVVRFASLAGAMLASPSDVVVVRAVTPALAVFLGRCAALVSETGGMLDHGAAMARELGIPCVVGCRDAWSRLHDGMLVTVDGDAGQVRTAAPDDPESQAHSLR